MPASATNNLQNLINARANLIQALADETNYQATYGAKPSYSVGDRNVSWTEWRDATVKQIDDLAHRIQDEGGPYQLQMMMTP